MERAGASMGPAPMSLSNVFSSQDKIYQCTVNGPPPPSLTNDVIDRHRVRFGTWSTFILIASKCMTGVSVVVKTT